MNFLTPTPKQPVLADGIELCKVLREALLMHGFYPALTGGLLYKEGPRKDIDIVIYRNRQDVKSFEMNDSIINSTLESKGIHIVDCYGFVTKAEWNGFSVDLFNPETAIEFEDDYGNLPSADNLNYINNLPESTEEQLDLLGVY